MMIDFIVFVLHGLIIMMTICWFILAVIISFFMIAMYFIPMYIAYTLTSLGTYQNEKRAD